MLFERSYQSHIIEHAMGVGLRQTSQTMLQEQRQLSGWAGMLAGSPDNTCFFNRQVSKQAACFIPEHQALLWIWKPNESENFRPDAEVDRLFKQRCAMQAETFLVLSAIVELNRCKNILVVKLPCFVWTIPSQLTACSASV